MFLCLADVSRASLAPSPYTSLPSPLLSLCLKQIYDKSTSLICGEAIPFEDLNLLFSLGFASNRGFSAELHEATHETCQPVTSRSLTGVDYKRIRVRDNVFRRALGHASSSPLYVPC